ncbi:MAG: T9SS type A sorting domain-containing protein [Ignavibacteria bacterium]|nr:MAG: T9SS type A sorting domain-containing protein [Ignavibacteria bacterium]
MKTFSRQILIVIILLSISDFNLFCQVSDYSSSQNHAEFGELVWAAKWFDDKNSAFSFSFDDGFISHYENVRPILNQFNFNATFYVMPPWLTDSLPGIFRYGTWPMFQAMAMDGHEIGSHTMNHLHLPELEIGDTATEGTILYEIYQARELINQRLPNQKCITMAYPFAEHNLVIDSLTSLFYESARASGNFPNESSLTNEQWFTLSAVDVVFNEPRNSLDDDLDELQFIQDWIDSLIVKEDWGILLGHEVVPQDSLPGLLAAGSWHPFTNEWFTVLSEWLLNKSNNKDVWVETIANVTRYIKERDDYNYSILTYDETQIKLNIFDNLDNEIYNYPLSVFIKVPQSWKLALKIQGETIDTLNVTTNDSGKVVLANIIPDGGVVSLFKMTISSAEDVVGFVPGEIQLFQNYPNPFNPSTTIKFSIPNVASSFSLKTTLKVYDILGTEIATLVNEEKPSGNYEVRFNSEDLSSGIYIYTLHVGNKMAYKKMILLR